MKKITIFLLQLFVAGVALGGPIEELDSFIETARQKWNVPGVAVVIVQNGQVKFIKGYGTTRVGKEETVDKETIFQLASITKTFTAAALGVQVDRNKIGWDDEISVHLPQFALYQPYSTRYATPRDLLAHRTGLPSFGGDLLGKLGYSREEILKRVRFIEPESSFRERAYYSNVGYFIAGELLAEVSNSTWEETVRTTLFEPLKMERSGFSDNLESKNVAYGHILEGNVQKVVGWDRSGGFPAAGAVTSTAADMGIWMRMLLNHGSLNGKVILKPETVQEMFRSSMVGEASFSETAPIDEYSGFDYGLGWANYHYMGRMIVEKGGGLDGIRTLVTLVPEKRLGITVLSNLNLTLLPEAIRAKFLELYLGENGQDLQALIGEKGRELTKMFQAKDDPPQQHSPSRPLRNFTGTFENELYGKFKVSLNQGRLTVDAGPAPYKGTLTYVGQDTFHLTWPAVNTGGESITFIFSPDGKVREFQTETLGIFKIP